MVMMSVLVNTLSTILLVHRMIGVQAPVPAPPPTPPPEPGLGADWYIDAFNAFAANYGNAAAESLSKEHDVVATGSVENFGQFNFRLLHCDNDVGAMSEPFPLIVSPNTESPAINGYGKAPTDGRTSAQLKHMCEYAIYVPMSGEESTEKFKEIRKEGGTQTIKLSINVMANGALTKQTANTIRVEFCQNVKKLIPARPAPPTQECYVHYKDTYHTASDSEKPDHTYFTSKTATIRKCSAWNDLCVEATIGTGDKPRFYFKILPMKHKYLAPKGPTEFSDKEIYCKMLKYSFRTKAEAKMKQELDDNDFRKGDQTNLPEADEKVKIADKDVRGQNVYEECIKDVYSVRSLISSNSTDATTTFRRSNLTVNVAQKSFQ